MEFFKKGRFNGDALQTILGCSNAAVSRVFQRVVNAVNTSPRLVDVWITPKPSQALFVGETWINIDRRVFYLIVVVNEEKEVLAWYLVKHRAKERMLSILKRAELRLNRHIPVLVTDDFSTYKGAAIGLEYDLTHARHVHQQPYGRICIDLIRHEKIHVKTIHVATLNDIFKHENTFLVRVSESRKIKYKTGKRGRKRGGRNRYASIIKFERKRKQKKAKRDPKNPFKNAKTHVYHYHEKTGRIGVWGNSNPKIGELVEQLAKVFKGKCMTTNLIEQEFNALKKLIDFRGNRTRAAWISTINFFFTV